MSILRSIENLARGSSMLVALLLFVTALVHAGCIEPDPGPPRVGAGGAGTTSSTTGGPATSVSASSGGGATPVCEGDVLPGSGLNVTIDTVEATVHDTAGAPVKDLLAQVCGLNLCKNLTTSATGHVLLTNFGQTLSQPSFKFGDGKTHVKIAWTLTDPITLVGTVTTAALPPPAEGAPMAPGADATSAGVTLSIPEDGVIEYDLPFTDPPEEYHFRAVEVPAALLATNPAVLAVDPPLQMFFGLAPLDTKFCPAVAVTAPNTAGFPAGAGVEFFVLGLNVDQEFAPYGSYEKVSDGQVSADGTTVSTSPGGGIPLLTVMAVRLKGP